MKNKQDINWFLKPKLSKKRVEEFQTLLEGMVEERYKMRSIPKDSFYKWANDKIEELYKFGRESASLSLQVKYEEEIKAIQKTLEIYEHHIKERGV